MNSSPPRNANHIYAQLPKKLGLITSPPARGIVAHQRGFVAKLSEHNQHSHRAVAFGPSEFKGQGQPPGGVAHAIWTRKVHVLDKAAREPF